jgi:hypothetical protein
VQHSAIYDDVFDLIEPPRHKVTEALDAVGLPCRPIRQARKRRTSDIEPSLSFVHRLHADVAATRRRVERNV